MQNCLINQMIIESNTKNKSFNLLLGDILNDDSDLKIINCYEDEQGIAGDFKEYLEEITAPKKIIGYLPDGGEIIFLEANKPIVAVYLKCSENLQLDMVFYEKVIISIFASLIRLELAGHTFKSIALPILFRKAITTIHEEAITVLITQATRWLKTSRTSSIRYYVYHEKDLNLWNAALNKVLQRVNFDITHAGDIQAVRKKILIEIDRFSKQESFYENTLMPLQYLLNRQELTIEPIAAFARKLIETLCELLSNSPGASLDEQIRELRQSNNYSRAFIQRLYLIKAFGNSAVHYQKQTSNYIVLNEQDLFILLLLVYETLQSFPYGKIEIR